MVYTSAKLQKLVETPPKYADADFEEVIRNLVATGTDAENKGDIQTVTICQKLLIFCDCNYFALTFLSDMMEDKEGQYIQPAQFHLEIYKKFETTDKITIICPRDHAKTTTMQFYVLWKVLTGRAKFVVIIGANGDDAKSKLEDIRLQLDDREHGHNKKLLKYFGKQRTKTSAWSNEKLVFANGAVLIPVGIDKNVRGFKRGKNRPDLVLLDDAFADRDLIKSKTRREEAFNFVFSDIIPLGKDIQIGIIGTIRHEEDPLARLSKLSAWECVKYGVSNLDGEPSMDFESGAELLWSERYTKEHWIEMKQEFEEAGRKAEFMNEYMSLPQDAGDAVFPRYDEEGRERKIFYEPRDHTGKIIDIVDWARQKELRIYQVIDPAYSSKKTADRKVSMIVGVDERTSIWYVLDMYAGRCQLDEFMNKILEQVKKWRPCITGIEANAIQIAFVQQLQQKAKDLMIPVNWEELKPGSQSGSKHDRIETVLRVRYMDNYLQFLKKEHTVLLDEMWSFQLGKQSKHDDCLDALAYMGQIVREPRRNVARPFIPKRVARPC